jgi:hypothetical protein
LVKYRTGSKYWRVGPEVITIRAIENRWVVVEEEDNRKRVSRRDDPPCSARERGDKIHYI